MKNVREINGVNFGVQSCWEEGQDQYFGNVFIPRKTDPSVVMYAQISAFFEGIKVEYGYSKSTKQEDIDCFEQFLQENATEIKEFMASLS